MRKVKDLLLEVTWQGQGIINFDGEGQASAIKNYGKDSNAEHLMAGTRRNNTKFAKHNFYPGRYSVKISGATQKKAFFDNVMDSASNDMDFVKELMYKSISSIVGFFRGYMKPDHGLGRKGFTVTDAEQIYGGISSMEIRTRSGAKKVNNDHEKDTTLFNIENIGDITYRGNVIMNLRELQFLSADDINGKKAILADDYAEYVKPEFNSIFPEEVGDLKYYNLSKSYNSIPEYGLLFSETNIKFAVKEFLRNYLVAASITRNNGWGAVKSVRLKYIYENENIINSKSEWIELNEETIDSLDFDISQTYVEYDNSLAKNIRERIQDAKKVLEEAKKDKKAREKAEKKEREAKSAPSAKIEAEAEAKFEQSKS